MNIWKRAAIYLTRKKGRSILLFLILFLMGTFVLIGLSIHNSAKLAAEEMQQSFGSGFNVYIKPELNRSDNVDGIPEFTVPQAEEIGKMSGITQYNIELLDFAQVDDITLVPGLRAYMLDEQLNDPDCGFGTSLEELRCMMRETTIFGNSDSELYEHFRTGAFSLAEGRHIKSGDQNKALISERVAQMNQLEIGDTITVSFTENMLNGGDLNKVLGGPIELEIVGIYAVNSYQPVSEHTAEADIAENWILADTETMEQLTDYYYEGFDIYPYIEKATYFVEDPAKLDTVIREVKDKSVLDEYYFDIVPDDTLYKSSIQPLNTMRNLTGGLIILLLCGSALVLSLIFTMWSRSRKKEIGIYLSMGIGKATIVGQLLVECLVIGVLAFGLSCVTANAVSNQVGNACLSAATPEPEEPRDLSQLSQQELEEAIISGNSSELSAMQTQDLTPETLSFTVKWWQVSLVLLAGCAIILLAVWRTAYEILKMTPKQILS
ncbi:ABC transporter permease [[Clostridium] hylemonae]|uniref:ABC transporter permease n=1 Tax=[Clostridium] hylemonae TaxID=89153 RepID=UPI001FCAD810|nr:FtsX-like permease family protein [[Clostridium] hylemonae]BDF04260.1 ABC transporter permease [[Clostridium] hylemonae]